MPTRATLRDLAPERIVLIKPSALGDIVHALPVLSALRSLYPAARITWVVNRAYESMLRGHPDLDATLPFDRGAARSGFFAGLRSWTRFVRNLRAERADLVIDLQGLLRSGLLTLASGARFRVGLSGSREGSRWAYTHIVPTPQRRAAHAVDRSWQVIEALGGGHLPKRFHLPLAPEAVGRAAEWLEPLPRPWLMLGPGSRWLTKRWLPEHFAALADRAVREFGGTVVLVGTPDEVPLAEAVRTAYQGRSLDLTGKTSLSELVAVLARADVMVANDTGPLHVAAALGRPVVAPYTCTKAAITGPYPPSGRVVETAVWCAGSYRRTCSRMECMRELTAARVWPVLREVMSECQQSRLSA